MCPNHKQKKNRNVFYQMRNRVTPQQAYDEVDAQRIYDEAEDRRKARLLKKEREKTFLHIFKELAVQMYDFDMPEALDLIHPFQKLIHEHKLKRSDDGDAENGMAEISLSVLPKRVTHNTALEVGEAANESGSNKVTPGSETPATTAATSTSPPIDIPEVILKSNHKHLCTEEDSSNSA